MNLTYDNFAGNLHDWFPDFKDCLGKELLKSLEDNPLVQFSLFIDFFYKNTGDIEFENKLIELLDRMNDVDGLQPVLDDFLIGVYSLIHEKGINLTDFINRLTPRIRATYELNVELWEKGNGITRS